MIDRKKLSKLRSDWRKQYDAGARTMKVSVYRLGLLLWAYDRLLAEDETDRKAIRAAIKALQKTK